MTLFKVKRSVSILALGTAFLIAGSAEVNAQSSRDYQREQQRMVREQRRIARENARLERERLEEERRLGRNYRRRDDRNGGVYGNVDRMGNSNAFRMGYDIGFQAGQYDRRKRKYNQSNVYRDSGGAYPNQGDPSTPDYLYRQGYLRGYEDGYNGGSRY